MPIGSTIISNVQNSAKNLDSGRHGGVAQSDISTEIEADMPIGYWKMNDADTTFTDSSGNGYNLTAVGSNNFQSTALATGSVYAIDQPTGGFPVNEGGGAKGASNVFSSITFPITLEAWVNLDNTGATHPIIFTHKRTWTGSEGYTGFHLAVNSSGAVYAFYGDGGNFGSTNRAGAQSTAGDITFGQTYHIVGVFNALGDVDIYINGSAVSTTGFGTATSLSTAAGYPTIGHGNFSNIGSNETTAQGTIDEVVLYDTALSAARISQHYAAGS